MTMGAWDTGSFSNDDALDFTAEIASPSDLEAKLDEALKSPAGGLESWTASEAVAAADVVASMQQRHASDVPEDIEAKLVSWGEPSPGLLSLARAAVERVLSDSELAELWAEAEEQDAWHAAMADLLVRLDPDAPYTPPEKPKPSSDSGGHLCALCMQRVSEDELVSAEIPFDPLPEMPDVPVGSMRTFFHRDCIAQKVQGADFNPDGSLADGMVDRLKALLFAED